MPRARRRRARRTFDARPDTADFRDRLFVPTLVEVPIRIDLDDYLAVGVPVLNQGTEGACTGFGLATVAHYLLRRREVVPDDTPVSTRMFYEMAKRYDEWPGEEYEGSSARGAMKGWHKHGVCAAELWPYRPPESALTTERVADALGRPLGAYFRVNQNDLVAMHAALAEVGILYATALVHSGWDEPGSDGRIVRHEEILGGHAFAIVAYDATGFWIQNSWGSDWGRDGLAHLSYDDWLANGTDVWVARLGVPIRLLTATATAASLADEAGKTEAYSFAEVRPHVVSVGNDGRPRTSGTYGTSEDDIQRIFEEDFFSITSGWRKKRLLLYAHGGLVGERAAIQRVAEYRTALLGSEVYPLAFIWKTDYWTTLKNILEDAVRRRRPEGPIEKAKDFLLDRLDDALEPLARTLTGKAQWDEMKENALLATRTAQGASRLVLKHLRRMLKKDPNIEIHLAGHSAGSIFLAPIVQLLTTSGKVTSGLMKGKPGSGLEVATCTLWAPACTVDLFKQSYLPAIKSGSIDRFALYTLTDDVERDDHCANIYNKSLLYLVSNAFEKRCRIPVIRRFGEPILGMEDFVRKDKDLQGLFKLKRADHVLAPNSAPEGSVSASRARHHGDFDDDLPTVRSTLARILAERASKASITFHSSAEKMRDRRAMLA